MKERVWRDPAAALALALLCLALYRKVLRLWWTFDDPWTIRMFGDSSLRDIFASGALWPQKLFTPALAVVFKSEIALFGLEPRPWYGLQLALLFAAALSAYVVMRTFADAPVSGLAAALFALGPPVCSVVTQLSAVHYLICIILGSISVRLFVAAARRGNVPLSIASAVFYLGALLSKEIAVVLPLLLLFLPVAERRRRLHLAIPHAAACVAYFLWRRAVLGAFLGAYNWVIEWREWPLLMASLPLKLAGAFAGTNASLGTILVAAMAATIALAFWRNRGALLLIVVGAVAAAGPLVLVSKELFRRYALVPWLAFAVAFAFAVGGLRPRRRAAALLMLLVPLLAAAANRQEWGTEFGRRQRMSDEARFFVRDIPDGALFRNPLTQGAVMRELNWLKSEKLGRPGNATVFYDDFYLCTHDVAGRRAWSYDVPSKMVVEITPALPSIARRHCSSIRMGAPLSAQFRFRDPALRWQFGPYAAGRYRGLFADGIEEFDLPRSGALNMGGATGVSLRIRYDSPEGWTTYSPELSLDFVKKPDFDWRR